MKKYVLEVNEAQMRTIACAVEDYARTRMGQFFDFSNDVARAGYVYDKSDPENDEKFDAYIQRRDACKEAFEWAFRIAQPWPCYKTDDMMIALDVWRVIRHQFYLERPEPKDHWTVDADEPFLESGQPSAKIEVKNDG